MRKFKSEDKTYKAVDLNPVFNGPNVPEGIGQKVVYNQKAKIFNHNNWTPSSAVTFSDNECQMSGSGDSFVRQYELIKAKHKYLVVFDYKASNDFFHFMLYSSNNTYDVIYLNASESYKEIIYFITASRDRDSFRIYGYGGKYSIKNLKIFDLTQLFGAGNEPTTLTNFYATPVGKIVQQGIYLPYSQENTNFYTYKEREVKTIG